MQIQKYLKHKIQTMSLSQRAYHNELITMSLSQRAYHNELTRAY